MLVSVAPTQHEAVAHFSSLIICWEKDASEDVHHEKRRVSCGAVAAVCVGTACSATQKFDYRRICVHYEGTARGSETPIFHRVIGVIGPRARMSDGLSVTFNFIHYVWNEKPRRASFVCPRESVEFLKHSFVPYVHPYVVSGYTHRCLLVPPLAAGWAGKGLRRS